MTGPIVSAFLVAGAALLLLAAVGVHRMPDVYTRMHAATKAPSLATLLLLAGAVVHFWTVATTVQALAIAGVLFLTLPVAVHLVGRAVYRAPPSEGEGPREREDGR